MRSEVKASRARSFLPGEFIPARSRATEGLTFLLRCHIRHMCVPGGSASTTWSHSLRFHGRRLAATCGNQCALITPSGYLALREHGLVG